MFNRKLQFLNADDFSPSSKLPYPLFYSTGTIASLIAAVAFTTPVIVPEFIFPLKLTIWPGTWMFFAYFTFLAVGVLGGLGWAALWESNTKVLWCYRDKQILHCRALWNNLSCNLWGNKT